MIWFFARIADDVGKRAGDRTRRGKHVRKEEKKEEIWRTRGAKTAEQA